MVFFLSKSIFILAFFSFLLKFKHSASIFSAATVEYEYQNCSNYGVAAKSSSLFFRSGAAFVRKQALTNMLYIT